MVSTEDKHGEDSLYACLECGTVFSAEAEHCITCGEKGELRPTTSFGGEGK